MANDEDLARIRQGAAAWNDWRAQNPERVWTSAGRTSARRTSVERPHKLSLHRCSPDNRYTFLWSGCSRSGYRHELFAGLLACLPR